MSGPRPHSESHNASDSLSNGPEKARLSIWFFCGALALLYGLVLIPAGIYQMSHPPNTVLQKLHPTFWWGTLLTLFGAFYVLKFRPK